MDDHTYMYMYMGFNIYMYMYVHIIYSIQYMSIKSHHIVTEFYCQYSRVITVSLLWCSIDKYTNY